MAKISFQTEEGGEKTYRLRSDRAMTVGRDPANDIVLRDAKVSRRHAEIIFERGFFVVHDLGSSNGSFVNGKRIIVAPLIDNVEVRFGNSSARFSEELSTPSPSSTSGSAVDGEGADAVSGAARSEEDFATGPQKKGVTSMDRASESSRYASNRSALAHSLAPEIHREPLPFVIRPVGASKPEAIDDERLRRCRFWIDLRMPRGGVSSVQDDDRRPLYYFKRPINLVGIVATLVGGFVVVSGIAAVAFLLADSRFFSALLAIALTVGFSWIIIMLIPRKAIAIFNDESLQSPSIVLVQESRFAFPVLRFSVRGQDGKPFAFFQKNAFRNLLKRTWWMYDSASGDPVGYAVEESLLLAALRKIGARVFGMRTNFRLIYRGSRVGVLDRRQIKDDRYALDLSADSDFTFDRRTALAFAVMIDGVER